MRVLWVGDTPNVSTGFARCTRAVCAELYAAGHEIAVLGINEFGDPQVEPDGWRLAPRYPYPIYRAKRRSGGDAFGAQRLPHLVAQLNPDVVVLLQDPWNVPEYFDAMDEAQVKQPPVVAWLAVDAKNHPHSQQLNRLAHVVTWTQFAIDELRRGGYTGTSSIVPLGVDTSQFCPGDRAEARRAVLPEGFSERAFVCGVVGRNQPRKRLDLVLAYFSEFLERYGIDDAYLYLHVAPTGEKSCDIRAVGAHYGGKLVGKVVIAAPEAGVGLEDSAMPQVYRAMDVLLTCTQGEGWCLPVHEAMACGIPVICPDWSALGEWPEDAVVKVPCTATALSAPLNLYPYTIGGIPDREATVKALWQMYAYKAVRQEYSDRGLALTARPELQWSAVGRAFRLELEAAVARAADRAVYELLGAPAAEGAETPAPESPSPPALVGSPQSAVLPRPAAAPSRGGIAVCVPVLCRYDLLRGMLLSLEKSKVRPSKVCIVDNGGDALHLSEAVLGIDLPIHIKTPAPPYGLAAAWNYFIGYTRGEDRIITNDDVVFAPDSIGRMLACEADLVFPVGVGFSCFLIRDSCVEKVGLFDESLSPGFAYFEDCDYMTRARARTAAGGDKGVRVVDLPGTGIQHLGQGSQRVERTADEKREFIRRYCIAQANYLAKWGKLPAGLRTMKPEEAA